VRGDGRRHAGRSAAKVEHDRAPKVQPLEIAESRFRQLESVPDEDHRRVDRVGGEERRGENRVLADLERVGTARTGERDDGLILDDPVREEGDGLKVALRARRHRSGALELVRDILRGGQISGAAGLAPLALVGGEPAHVTPPILGGITGAGEKQDDGEEENDGGVVRGYTRPIGPRPHGAYPVEIWSLERLYARIVAGTPSSIVG